MKKDKPEDYTDFFVYDFENGIVHYFNDYHKAKSKRKTIDTDVAFEGKHKNGSWYGFFYRQSSRQWKVNFDEFRSIGSV